MASERKSSRSGLATPFFTLNRGRKTAVNRLAIRALVRIEGVVLY